MGFVCELAIAVERHATFVVPEAPIEAQRAAEKGRKTLEQLVKNDDKHAQELGLTSSAEARDTALGTPFPILFVELEKLKQFQRGEDPRNLLEPTDEFIYPILVGGNVKSSLTVTRTPQGWRATAWGADKLIRLLDNARVADSNFLVSIPSLNLQFIGDITEEPFKMIPILDERRYGFMRMRPLPAQEVFAKLLPEAKAHDGNPR
jgi:hypothetical protein